MSQYRVTEFLSAISRIDVILVGYRRDRGCPFRNVGLVEVDRAFRFRSDLNEGRHTNMSDVAGTSLFSQSAVFPSLAVIQSAKWKDRNGMWFGFGIIHYAPHNTPSPATAVFYIQTESRIGYEEDHICDNSLLSHFTVIFDKYLFFLRNDICHRASSRLY